MTPKTPGFRVLVKPDTLEQIDPNVARARAAGIKLLETTERQERVTIETGTVVQVGPTAFKEYGGDPWCKAGDRISYARHGGMYVKNPDNQDESWLVINDEDVVVVWE